MKCIEKKRVCDTREYTRTNKTPNADDDHLSERSTTSNRISSALSLAFMLVSKAVKRDIHASSSFKRSARRPCECRWELEEKGGEGREAVGRARVRHDMDEP
jgi:hypothetical protein